jgi:hypothetical protein
MTKRADLIPCERIQRAIYLIRGEKVMLDADLAALYGVETGALNRAVKRNANRFPADFMLQLTAEEAENLRCQTGISSSGYGGRRYSAYEPVSVLTFDTFEQRAEGEAERLKAGGPYREAEIGRSESWNLVSRIRSGDGGVARPLRQDRVGA